MLLRTVFYTEDAVRDYYNNILKSVVCSNTYTLCTIFACRTHLCTVQCYRYRYKATIITYLYLFKYCEISKNEFVSARCYE